MENGPKLIILGVVLLILTGGIFAISNLTRQPQVIKSKAFEGGLTLEMISPRSNSKVLGLIQVKSQVKTSDTKNLSAVLKVEDISQPLEVEEISEETILLTSDLDSSKFSPGNHTLELFLYKSDGSGPQLLGSTQVSVTIVAP